MIRQKPENVCTALNYIEYIFYFSFCNHCFNLCLTSLVGIFIGIASSSEGLRCARTALTKKYKSIIEKIDKNMII